MDGSVRKNHFFCVLVLSVVPACATGQSCIKPGVGYTKRFKYESARRYGETLDSAECPFEGRNAGKRSVLWKG